MAVAIDSRFLWGLLLESETDAGMTKILDFCKDIGLIAKEYKCPVCGKNMAMRGRPNATDRYEWVCRANTNLGKHRVKRSVRRGSWFGGSNLGIGDILLMTYYFVNQLPQKFIAKDMRVSTHTVCDWRSSFREACTLICKRDNSEKIGGPGTVVEIDEWRFGKRSGGGKRVDGLWVFGGIQRDSNKCFLRAVEKKDKGTLLEIIKSSVLPGTTIYLDNWRSYDCLEEEEGSFHFKDPETGANTNSIKGTWSAVKRELPSRTVTDEFDYYLGEYIWRRSRSDRDDLMRAFLEDVVKIYPPPGHDLPQEI